MQQINENKLRSGKIKPMLMKYALMMLFFSGMLLNSEAQTGFHNIKIDSLDGKTKIDFSFFKNKKVLLVVSASKDSCFRQLEELSQLKKMYANKLEVVVIPSNDFGTEPAEKDALSSLYHRYAAALQVAAKTDCRKKLQHPLIDWLDDQQQNGAASLHFNKAFQKILVGKNGHVIGIFNSDVSPLNNLMIRSLENSY